jgi:hypothetical protein
MHLSEKVNVTETDKGISPWTKSPFLTAMGKYPLHAVALFEPFDTTGGVNQLLLAREERVACRTDFSGNLGLG